MRSATFRAAAASLAASLVLVACAVVPERAPVAPPAAAQANAFDTSGRFSARHGNEGVAGQFSWTHRDGSDRLTFSTPLGQALAQLTGDASGVRLELPDGHVERATDWQSLTEKALGVPVPVRGLAWWIRARARPGAPHTEELDPQSRTSLLRQDGWEIVYGYADGASEPSRLRLAYPGIELRLVIDAWH